MGRYTPFLAFSPNFIVKNAPILQPTNCGCKFVFLFSSSSLLLPFSALFFFFLCFYQSQSLKIAHQLRCAAIYIYIYFFFFSLNITQLCAIPRPWHKCHPSEGVQFGCVCSYMAGHEDAGVATGRPYRKKHTQICTPSLGATALWPHSNGAVQIRSWVCQRRRDDNENKIFAFWGGGPWGQRGKSSKTLFFFFFVGNATTAKILNLKILLSRNVVVIAQAPSVERADNNSLSLSLSLFKVSGLTDWQGISVLLTSQVELLCQSAWTSCCWLTWVAGWARYAPGPAVAALSIF